MFPRIVALPQDRAAIWWLGYMLIATMVMLWISRRIFYRALQSYRSASS